MKIFKNKVGFTLIEVMFALAIAAFILTSLYILQSGALTGVLKYSAHYHRMIYAKNFLLNTRRVREESKNTKQFKLEKKEEDPETYLKYSFGLVEKGSLKELKTIFVEKVEINNEAKQKQPSATLLTLTYVPEDA